MTWRNVTLHELQDITFRRITGVHYTDIVVNPALISTSTPHILDALASLHTQVIITQLSDPLTLTISPVPDETATPISGTVMLLDTPIQLTPSITPDAVTYTLQMMYTDQQLLDAGLDETTLAIQYWNATTQTWTALPSIVDPVSNTVEATLTHFSIFTLTGAHSPLWTQPWFLGLLGGVGVGVAGLGFGLRRRARRSIRR
jgi:hypothetical protein